jgi:hypothetical protein
MAGCGPANSTRLDDVTVVCCFLAADVISAVEFDADGSYLATGDKGGRVVLFEKVPTQPVSRPAISVGSS